MTPIPALQQNLKACMAMAGYPQSQPELAKKSGVGQNTISRILSKGENVRLETLSKIARAYDLDSWQLLVPGMDPRNPPVLQPVSNEERELWNRIKDAFRQTAKQWELYR